MNSILLKLYLNAIKIIGGKLIINSYFFKTNNFLISWNKKWCAECKRIEREKEKEYLKELERKH